MIGALALVALLRAQGGATTPPSRDTVGYWQQQADYRITAVLDEAAERLRARGTLRYVNRSPDTLRVLWLHQYLNAFRPQSRWSASDTREERVRFQALAEREQGFERLTSPPTVNGSSVRLEYPGAPDSTVARLTLSRPLAPRETAFVAFAWEARPSTVPRRQGRRGRTYDLAQWYPKVAVYDRRGWEPNALVPAGELYGEFGAFDVTLVVRDDQVVAGTGVVTAGDPGWAGVAQGGRLPPTVAVAYEGDRPDTWLDRTDSVAIPSGHRVVRFRARSVHHFAWSASPDYRYEGGTWVRAAGAARMPFRTWDTVAVHVLYKRGDEATWGQGQAVERTREALRWLERVYGPYGYPQLTNVHRLDGGGTEFPMMMMNGSASASLILHEGGHIFTYGILANNEWRSGWMDEGLTSYQTAWALGDVPQARAEQAPPPTPRATGYRAFAITPTPFEAEAIADARFVLNGSAEPIGRPAHEFREFTVYNAMVYGRASEMYSALRDVLGDSAFARFLNGYYARWGMKHVDEEAMRAEAERAWGGRDLSWFFRQWVHETGLVDYSAERADKRRVRGGWETDVTVRRVGSYGHLMQIGVRTDSGWTLVPLADAQAVRQLVTIATAREPREVRLDPFATSGDWRPENNVIGFADAGRPLRERWNWDWPFLAQASRGAALHLHRPSLWYTDHGGLTIGWSVRESLDGWLSRIDWGIATPTRSHQGRLSAFARVDSSGRTAEWQPNLWFEWAEPYVGGRALVGARAGLAIRDGIARIRVGTSWDLSPLRFAPGVRRSLEVGLAGWSPRALAYVDASRWTGTDGAELSARFAASRTDAMAFAWSVHAAAGAQRTGRMFGRSELVMTQGRAWGAARGQESHVRGYVGWAAAGAPLERQIWSASVSPFEAYDLDWYRGAGAPLSRRDVGFNPLGGGALRGFAPLAVGALASVTLEHDVRFAELRGTTASLALSASIFADAGVVLRDGALPAGSRLGDAGLGVIARGRIFDRAVRLRADFPLFVSRPALAVGTAAAAERFAFRWTFSFSDLW